MTNAINQPLANRVYEPVRKNINKDSNQAEKVDAEKTKENAAKQAVDESLTGKKTGEIIGNDLHALGKEEFLKLLVTQLSKQNPLDPVNDREFIAQMAQFSALEQMKNVSGNMQKLSNEIKSFKDANIKTMQNLESYSLLNKKVTGFDVKTQQSITGTVKSVYRDRDGEMNVQIEKDGESHDIKLSHINKAEANDVSRETPPDWFLEHVTNMYINNQQTTKGEQAQ